MRYKIRRATDADADAIADAHMASIHTLGALYYEQGVISEWGKYRDGSSYIKSMANGEVIHIAVQEPENDSSYVLGFSFYMHHQSRGEHETGVYVREEAARIGLGKALYEAAENAARERGASEFVLDSSLGAVDFYKKLGFEETGKGEHRFNNGFSMSCVLMRKCLLSHPLSNPPPQAGEGTVV